MSRYFAANRGYLSFAINNDNIDYVKLAYVQALSIKLTQKINNYAVVVNLDQHVEEKYLAVFDHVIRLPEPSASGYQHEIHAWDLTPFKQTVKLESDILLTSNIDHWWDCYQHRDVVVTQQVLTYWNSVFTDRSQRKLFDHNHLPNVYSGWVYFRYSQPSFEFYQLVKSIYANWGWFRDYYLKGCRYEYPVTDEVYAIACKIMGLEHTTLPISVPTFVHMKNAGQNLSSQAAWHKQIQFEMNQNQITLGFHKQSAPLHYCDKSFITESIVNEYESRFREICP